MKLYQVVRVGMHYVEAVDGRYWLHEVLAIKDAAEREARTGEPHRALAIDAEALTPFPAEDGE